MNGTNLLIDTNIFLEILFDQDRHEVCHDFMRAINQELFGQKIYITDFSLHAIQAACRKKNAEFIRDLLLTIRSEKISVVRSTVDDDMMTNLIRKTFNLDFDDAIQYMAALRTNSKIVTYDKDFDNKEIEATTPEECLRKIIKN